MGRLLARHTPLLVFALVCAAFAAYSPYFREPANLSDVVSRSSIISIIALGQLLVILTGGIDLSVGSVAALSGVVGCLVMRDSGVPFPVAAGVIAGTLTGLACGTINGVLTAYGRIQPFIVTLGMMMAARAATLLASGGVQVGGLPSGFMWLGGGKWWAVPVLFTATLGTVIALVLNFTAYGRALYAIGGNREAARLSGIPVARVRLITFALCGMLAGFAGMVLSSRTVVATPNAAEVYELHAIAACVIGGASLLGGEGGAFGALAGALLMEVLRNFCTLEGIDTQWQQIFIGTLLVLLVGYDAYRKRRAGLVKE